MVRCGFFVEFLKSAENNNPPKQNFWNYAQRYNSAGKNPAKGKCAPDNNSKKRIFGLFEMCRT